MTRAWAALAACFLFCGCRDREVAPVAPPAAPSAAPVASATGLDRVAPGELPESKDRYFGFAFPRSFRVDAAFGDFADATGDVEPEVALAYARQRVDGGHVEMSTTRWEIRNTHVNGAPPDQRVHVVVERTVDGRTRIRIRDVTPVPPPPAGMSETDRWKAVGADPQGRPLDPKHTM